MTTDKEVRWDARQFQIDRFDLHVTETSRDNSGSKERNERVASLYGLSKSPLLCQADGCNVDVTKMKEYNSRYKICETHLRAKLVTKDGKPQRFCQQCGKFHDIDEFDGDKRSCRARLDKHNARRRRQREMQHMLKTTGRIDEAALRAKYGLSEEELAPKVERLAKQMRMSGNGSGVHRAEGFSFGQQPHMERSSNSSASGNALVSLTGFAGIPGITQEDLDLLGDSFLGEVLAPSSLSVPLPVVTGGQVLNNGAGAADFLSIDPSSVMDLDDISVLEELTQDFGMPPNVAAYAAANLPSKGSFSSGPDPLQSVFNIESATRRQMEDEHQMHLALGLLPNSNVANGNIQSRTVTTGINPPPFPRANVVPTHNANSIFNIGGSLVQPPVTPSQGGATATATGGGGSLNLNEPVSVLEEALNLLAYDYQNVHFLTEEKLIRFSAKLFGCTPAELPTDLRASLTDMLAVDAMEGYMRPGCVHLEINAMAKPGRGEEDLHAAVNRFLSHPGTAAMASSRMLVLQLDNKIAVVDKGKLSHVIDTSGAKSILPRILAVDQGAVLAPSAQPALSNDTNSSNNGIRLVIQGYNFDERKDKVLVRMQGRHLQAKIVSNSCVPVESNQRGVSRMEVEIKDDLEGAFPSSGCLHIEIMRGSYISPARCVVVAPSIEILQELDDVICGSSREGASTETLAYHIGVVLEASFNCGNRSSLDSTTAIPLAPHVAASRLVPFLLQKNKPKLTRMALDVAYGSDYVQQSRLTASLSSDDKFIEAIHEGVEGGGDSQMPLLFAAVRTKSFEMVSTVLDWAKARGISLRATQATRMHKNLTPLHLAALINDGGKIAQLLTEECDDAPDAWGVAKAVDGTTPMALAARVGTSDAINAMLVRHKLADSIGKGKEAAASSSRSSSSTQIYVRTDSSVQIQRGHAQGHAKFCLLGFYAPELEAAYRPWFHLGQLTIDRVFQTIVIVYLLASMVSLPPSQSDKNKFDMSWTIMSLLLVFNAVVLLFSMVAQRLYIKYRDWHCVTSLVLHRVANSLAYSSFSARSIGLAAALLDASSFPQVLLLCIGAKGRVMYMLPALLVTVGLSMPMNGDLCAATFPNWTPAVKCEFSMRVLQTCCGFLLPAAVLVLMERRYRYSFLRSLSSKAVGKAA